MAKLWFYSDPHFNHKNVIKFCDRPFADLTQMNEALIKNYNNAVGPDDTCIWVGDCFWGRANDSRDILSRLNGKKILVLGNHDKGREAMMNMGFDFACYEMVIRLQQNSVTIKHYPLRPPWYRLLWMRVTGKKMPKYLNRQIKDTGRFHIHGHVHYSTKYNKRQIHVGVDAWKYAPVSSLVIEKYIREYKSN